MVEDLKAHALWNDELAESLKAVDGQLKRLPSIPTELADKYPDIYDIDQSWLIRAAAVRGKWIDQSQSLNLFVKHASGKTLHELYLLAWEMGLKTTYYLRTLGASQVEKATVDTARFGKTHLRQALSQSNETPSACSLTDPDCEACQ
jgi:ribonucleoside-diphosphate reductase alpha chain